MARGCLVRTPEAIEKARVTLKHKMAIKAEEEKLPWPRPTIKDRIALAGVHYGASARVEVKAGTVFKLLRPFADVGSGTGCTAAMCVDACVG